MVSCTKDSLAKVYNYTVLSEGFSSCRLLLYFYVRKVSFAVDYRFVQGVDRKKPPRLFEFVGSQFFGSETVLRGVFLTKL